MTVSFRLYRFLSFRHCCRYLWAVLLTVTVAVAAATGTRSQKDSEKDVSSIWLAAPQLQVSDITGSFDWQKVERAIPKLEKPWYSTKPKPLVAGWRGGELRNSQAIMQLVADLERGEYAPVDSLLITSRNRLVFESYFAHGRQNLPHFQASATKSWVSFAIGRAIEMGYLRMEDLHKPIVSFFDDIDASKLVHGADKITLHHTLSMRSGLRFSEAKTEKLRQFARNPQRVQGQKLAQVYLTHSTPVTRESQGFHYQGADPRLSMLVLQSVLPGSAQDFIKTELLHKLGIRQYFWEDHPSGLPEAGYHTSFTVRDMSKLGILLKQQGSWQGQQLISKAYLQKGTSKVAQPQSDDGDFDYSNFRYGYYFWGTKLQGRQVTFDANMAWGGGGQYVIAFEDLDLVIAVTARGRGLEDKILKMVEQRILPSFYIDKAFPELTGPLMGQTPPGETAEVFAPGVISMPGWEIQALFSPDMQEFYFTTAQGEATPIMVLGFRQQNKVWKKYTEFIRRGELGFTPDGKRMLMARGYKQRRGKGWSKRKTLSALINEFRIMRLSASVDGTWVFDEANIPGVIRMSEVINGERQQPVILGPQINTGELAAHPFIAPDGSYLIWDAIREGGFGRQDLYISFRQTDDSWGEAINMGPQVNSATGDTYATVTSDGKYLLFNRRIDDAADNSDIYWVDAGIISKLKAQHMQL